MRSIGLDVAKRFAEVAISDGQRSLEKRFGCRPETSSAASLVGLSRAASVDYARPPAPQ